MGSTIAVFVIVFAVLGLLLGFSQSFDLQSTEINQTSTSAQAPYTPPILIPDIEDSKMKQMTEIAKNYQGLRDWSPDEWEVMTTAYRGTIGDSISYDYAIFYLRLPEEADAPKQCPGGWEAVIEVNMKTMEASPLYIPSLADSTCPVPISSR